MPSPRHLHPAHIFYVLLSLSEHPRVIIKLGPPSGTIVGADIDTAHFSGNEGPAASVAACFLPEGTPTATGSHVSRVCPPTSAQLTVQGGS